MISKKTLPAFEEFLFLIYPFLNLIFSDLLNIDSSSKIGLFDDILFQ